MSQILLFGILPICKYMLYLIYLGLFLISSVILTFHFTNPKRKIKLKLEKVLERKQKERHEEFQHCREYLEERIQEDEVERIVTLGMEDLAGKIERREISSVKTLHAFMLKALLQSDRLNCVTDFNPSALKIAESLDVKLAESGKTVGPLHGIPVCIKEDHDIEGMDTTLGNSQYLFKPKQSSAILVESLLHLGAIPFCKTNVPQTLMSNGSTNPIFGATKNCFNIKLSPAGSSSGSASLIGAGGALIGTGSDFGGSLRAPAHFCGISSIKPTVGRLSPKGLQSSAPCIGLPSVPGLLGKDSQTVALVFRCLVDKKLQHEFDPSCVPLNWNDEEFSSNRTLTIGYFTSLPFFPTIGDTASTVLSAKHHLEKSGHKLVPFELPDSYELYWLFMQLASADDGQNLLNILEKEPQISKDLTETWPFLFASNWNKRISRFAANQSWHPSYSKRLSMLMQETALTPAELWKVWLRRNELRAEVLDSMKKCNIDVIISPTFAFPAITLEDTRKLISASYTQTWSFLDFPVGVTRFGTETGENIDSYDDEGDSLLKLAKGAAKNSTGMPIGLQVIGKPFEEETVLRTMCQLDELYKSVKICRAQH